MISVIIVSYNNPDLLKQTLVSLKKYHSIAMEIIVVDNSENNEVLNMINAQFKEIIFLKMERNIGFGRANNIGIKKAKGNIIALLNNDLIFEQDVLTLLIEQINANSMIGIIGPKLLNKDRSLQYSCCNFPTVFDIWKAEIKGDQMVKDWYLTDWDHGQRRELGYISGALMVMRRELFESVGMFDEIFFMYSEEVDLCYRVNKAGYKIVYFPEVSAIHLGGASTKSDPRAINTQLYLSRLKFRRKHFGVFSTIFQILGIGFIAILKGLLGIFKILLFSENRALRINQLARNYGKVNLMFRLLIILILGTKTYFLHYDAGVSAN